jgi:hypothetical protein
VVAFREIEGNRFLVTNAPNGCFDSGAVNAVVEEGDVIYVRIDPKDWWESISAGDDVRFDNVLNSGLNTLEDWVEVGAEYERGERVALTTTSCAPSNTHSIVHEWRAAAVGPLKPPE